MTSKFQNNVTDDNVAMRAMPLMHNDTQEQAARQQKDKMMMAFDILHTKTEI